MNSFDKSSIKRLSSLVNNIQKGDTLSVSPFHLSRPYFSSKDRFFDTVTVPSKHANIALTFSFCIFGLNILTTGTTTSPAIIATAPALIGEAMYPMNILDTVMPTPQIKLAHTAALVTPFQYKP